MTVRVLVVGPTPPPFGGVATHVQAIVRALSTVGAAGTLVDPHRGRARLAARLLAAHGRNDVVHVHVNGHNRKSWLLAALGRGRRSVVTVHSGLAPAFCAEHPRLVLDAADGYTEVVAVSPAIADALRTVGLPAAHLHVIPAFSSALPLPIPPPGLRAIRREHLHLLAAALGEGPEYGAEQLLTALGYLRDRLPQAGTVLYGPGSRTAEVARTVVQRRLSGRVHLFGELEPHRALAVVKAADIFVRPTLADGDSISIREALALGRPVVASAVGFRPVGVRTYPAEDPAALAELLFQALGTPISPPPPEVDAISRVLSLYARL
jgi:glycosyltransferase involved in cell wall biosynthesis